MARLGRIGPAHQSGRTGDRMTPSGRRPGGLRGRPPTAGADAGPLRRCHTGRVGRLPVIAIVGATAAGKSDLAVELALRLGGEVINADSMQLYRGMDIGTAKLSPAERRGVPHHLL